MPKPIRANHISVSASRVPEPELSDDPQVQLDIDFGSDQSIPPVRITLYESKILELIDQIMQDLDLP